MKKEEKEEVWQENCAKKKKENLAEEEKKVVGRDIFAEEIHIFLAYNRYFGPGLYPEGIEKRRSTKNNQIMLKNIHPMRPDGLQLFRCIHASL